MISTMSLSREELCFAIFTESHAMVSTSLFEFALNAVKASHPTKWKGTICSSLGTGVGRYVKQRLENNLPVTDIYAVCRILCCRINDVVNFCGGNTLYPREKEKLCLQIGGVEVARYCAFHGDQYLSAGEVRSSIALLISVLRTLSCRSDKMNAIAKELSMLLEYSERLASHDTRAEYILRAASVRCVLLKSSLAELKRNYVEFFDKNPGFASFNQGEAMEDFLPCLKQIRKALQERRNSHKQSGSDHEKFDCIKTCNDILSARNALAHNAQLTVSRVRQALTDISNILHAFDLSCNRTSSALKSIKAVLSQECHSEEMCCCFLEEENRAERKESRERLLRACGQYFIGRESETLSIKSALGKELPEGRRGVVLFGTAGVGKSYLATNVAHDLVNVFSKQTWLNCSDDHELQHHLLHDGESHAKNEEFYHLRSIYRDGFSQCNFLVVFDDVCSSTMRLVSKSILNLRSDSCALITTRSTTVKQFFQRALPSLIVIQIKPFSLSESWSLLQSKVNKTNLANTHEDTRLLIGKMLSGALGNLPLCVSIYSSLLARNLRKSCSAHERELQSSQFYETWKVVEECFGDRYHVRGLTGIVTCAEAHLEDCPLVVLLLAKIALADAEHIPWKILSNSQSELMSLGVFCTFRVDFNWTDPDNILSGLLGVIDWLFSDYCKDMLEICRNTLEELGLISWEESSSSVCIHNLTLEGVRDMLDRRTLFLNNLLLYSRGDNTKAVRGIERASKVVSATLLLQTLGSCLDVLDALIITNEDRALKEAISLFEYLSKYVVNNTPVILREMLSFPLLGVLKSLLVHMLYSFSAHFGIHVPQKERKSWLEVYAQFPISQKNLEIMTISFGIPELAYQCQQGQTAPNLDELLGMCIRQCGVNSIETAGIHCIKAECIGRERGTKAQKRYMEIASLTCPQLLTDLTYNGVCSEILRTTQAEGYNIAFDNFRRRQVTFWHVIILFKIREYGLVGKETLDIFLLLIILCQQRHRLISEEINRESSSEESVTFKKMILCSVLIDEALSEVTLWSIVPKRCRSLRILVKTYVVIEQFLIKHTPAIFAKNKRLTEALMCGLAELIDKICTFLIGLSPAPGISISFRTVLSLCKKTNMASCFLGHGQWSGSFDLAQLIGHGILDELCGPILLLKEVQSLYESMAFQDKLSPLLTILKKSLCNKYGRIVQHQRKYITYTVGYIGGLCAMLGRRRSADAVKQLISLSECSTVPVMWKSVLEHVVAEVSILWETREQSYVCDSFMQSRRDFETRNAKSALRAALSCWKEVWHALEVQLTNCETWELPPSEIKVCLLQFFAFMIFELAGILSQLYTKDGRFGIAEWFLKFRLEQMKGFHLFLRVVSCSVEYIIFLKECGRNPEALALCRTVERDLEEELGNDYPEWLQDMPKIAVMRKELEEYIGQTDTNGTVQ